MDQATELSKMIEVCRKSGVRNLPHIVLPLTDKQFRARKAKRKRAKKARKRNRKR